MKNLSRSVSLLLLLFLIQTVYSPAQNRTGEPGLALSEKPIEGEWVRTTIAVPDFQVTGSSGGLDPSFFPQVIYGDLELFSEFQRARNQTFVNQTHQRDTKESSADRVDFAQWQRLPCDFVLKGTYSVDSQNRITADCRLFDVTYGVRTFGLRYVHPMDQARRLAHRISDDIVKAVFDVPGIASTKIVFRRMMPNQRDKELFLMDADGQNLRQLTFDNSLSVAPCWGMNGTEIYYTSYRDVNPDLCGILVESGRTWFVSRRPGLNVAPSWSQQNKRISVSLGRDGNSELYTMDRSGDEKTLRRLTHTPAIETSPSWNPAGNQMVFTSDRNRYQQIWIMDADGTNPHRISRGTYDASPVWSPLGDKIAFASLDRGNFDIYLMNIDGSGLTQITDSPANDEDPAWAPDGRHIVFSSERTGRYEIHIMRVDGTRVQRLTSSLGSDSAAWSPLRVP